MKDRGECLGWAYEGCARAAIGILYQGYVDRHWESQPICLRHFLEVISTFESRTELPSRCELHAFDSVGPSWTRV
jgi:hypothetical protein